MRDNRHQKKNFYFYVFIATCLHIKPRSPKLQFVADQEAALHECMLQRSSKESSCALPFTQMKLWMFCFYLPFMSALCVSFHGLKCWLQKWMKIKRLPSQGWDLPHPQGTQGCLLLCETPFSASEAAAWGHDNDKPPFI